jgi:hypothetical protein
VKARPEKALEEVVEPVLPTPARRITPECLEKPQMGPIDSTSCHAGGATTADVIEPPPDSHTTDAQALRMIQALRVGPVSSIAAAQQLDIVHPPSTIRHLRKLGWGILTRWCYQAAAPGRRPHRVGLYVLVKENQ